MSKYRVENDTFGEIRVPINAMYGAQTQRAIENFPISTYRASRALIWALGTIKQAAAFVNCKLGLLDKSIADAIINASIEIASGKWDDSFVVDVFQSGAGTSHHMNANEVIANRATLLLGGSLGEYLVHPNNHVNMSQSTNDVIPTAIRLGCLWRVNDMLQAIDGLVNDFINKGNTFNSIIKSGRTHLQDAVPIRLGQEFTAYAHAIESDRQRIKLSSENLRRLGIGGTATGSGLNAHPEYQRLVVDRLIELTSFPLLASDDLFESMQSMADFLDFSSSMRILSFTLTRIANDLRLLSSGPNTGLDEVRLPAVQPGSSIMPGKVNPVMAEMLNMAMYHVIGCDTTIALASQAGQLELNVMMPIIAHNLLEMMHIMTSSIKTFSTKCANGITANPERTQFWLERNPIIVTILNPLIGYDAGAKLIRLAASKNQPIYQVAINEARNSQLINITNGQLVSPNEIKDALNDLARIADGGIINQT